MIKVFFDASAIFSALYSNQGGSYRLTSLVAERKIIGVTTQTVIKELEKNLKKIKNIAKKEFHQFIIRRNFIVREKISESEIKPFLDVVDKKNAHVVAGAILTGCDHLVTLDKKHLNNSSVKAKISKIKIISPKESLSIILGDNRK